jgi:hypothetical protein
MSAVSDEVRPKEETVSKPELSVKEQIVAKLDNLPVDRLQQLLDFAEFLENKVTKPQTEAEVDAPESNAPTVPPKAQPKPDPDEETDDDEQMFVPDAEERISRLEGSLAHLNIRVTEEDIREVRREMWANFPREDEQIWGDYLKKGATES